MRAGKASAATGLLTGAAAPHIEVSVRVRPGTSSVINIANGEVEVQGQQFIFATHVLTGSDQQHAFDALARTLLQKLQNGFNSTLFAYGQTGSGKTHTMFGAPGCLSEASLEGLGSSGFAPAWGILPRALLTLLRSLPPSAKIHASAIEVYQELAYDLLNERSPLVVGTKGSNQLSGNEGVAVGGNIGKGKEAVGGVHPAGCRCRNCVAVKEAKAEELKRKMAERRGENYFTGSGMDPMKMAKEARAKEKAAAKQAAKPVAAKSDEADDFTTVGETLSPLTSAEEVMRFCRTVELSRTTVGHNLNERSSRSHCLVHVHVAERKADGLLVKKLLLVDLAGSERIAKSGVEGVARAQAVAINSSLTALGRVIEALGKGHAHVPYRDATLTMLLRSSFAGRSSTSVVINVADEEAHTEETLCSLAFGSRLAVVRNTAARVATQSLGGGGTDGLEAALTKARDELEALRIAGKGAGFGHFAEPSAIRAFEETERRLEEVNGEIRSLQIAKQEGGGGGAKERLAALQGQAKQLKQNISNSKNAVDRLTKEPFWHEATPAFLQKEREVKELIARRQLAQG